MQINGELVVVGQGVPNFEALKENRDNFLDPITNLDYQVGFYEVGLTLASTTDIQGIPNMLQIATYSEEHNVAVVVGNFMTSGVDKNDTKGLIKGEDGEVLVNGEETIKPSLPTLPVGVEALEPTTIGCPNGEEDIIATIDGKKLRIAGCNAWGTSGNGTPEEFTWTDKNNRTHNYYTWENGTNWCESKGMRLITRSEYTDMINKFEWTFLVADTSAGGRMDEAYQSLPPYNMYSAGWAVGDGTSKAWQGTLAGFHTGTEDELNSGNTYIFFFNTVDMNADGPRSKTTGYSVRCVKDLEDGITISGGGIDEKGFTWQDLIFSYDGESTTIMDRNLGATIAYNGTDTEPITSELNATPYLGDYYQWGSRDTTIVDNDDLLGLTWDTDETRQGPCPIGRHVPTILEWIGLIQLWYQSNKQICTAEVGGNCAWTGTATLANFKNDFKLPLAGYLHPEGVMGNGGTFGRYWSSSPNSSEALYMYFFSAAIIPQYSATRSTTFSVRCFKN